MLRRNPPIPDNILKRYRGVKALAEAESAPEGERAAARAALAQLEERYPGVAKAAAAPAPAAAPRRPAAPHPPPVAPEWSVPP